MRLRAPRAQQRVLFTEGAHALLVKRSVLAAPFETGGLLLGFQTHTGPFVTSVVEIVAVAPAPARFVIPSDITQAIVQNHRNLDPRVGYLGDWHSHPASVGPSFTDFATLESLARDGRGPRLIALVRPQGKDWIVQAWRWDGRRPAGCVVELAGPVHEGEPRLDSD